MIRRRTAGFSVVMRLARASICTLAVALIGCLPDSSSPEDTSILSDDDKVAWISANSVKVRSVDADDTDFSDLEPLRAAIGDARIVMLGEATHGDGTSFAAKVRLIRFLHAELGFDMLAFEAGMFDTREAWKSIVAGDDVLPTVQESIFGIWSKSEEVRPLFEYVSAHASSVRPLELVGIDPQFTGPVGGGTGARFVEELEAHLAMHGSRILDEPTWPSFRSVVDRIARQHYRTIAPTGDEVSSFEVVMPNLRLETTVIESQSPGFASAHWNQLMDALDAQGRAWWARAADGGNNRRYSVIRDASMFRNLSWMLESGYPDRKIIVWAHNGHVQSNTQAIRALDGSFVFDLEFRPLGELARVTYGDALYSVGFLAGSGQYGYAAVQSGAAARPERIPTPPAGSLDALFMQTGHAHLFLDLRQTLEGDGLWARYPHVAGPLNYAPMQAPWPVVFDALFFTRVMAPATPVR